MSQVDSPKPPPSPEEIQAYLELSAARTKKRLPLAGSPMEKTEAVPAAPRALPLTSSGANPPKRDK
jgi:hypothetical protein